MGSKYCRAMPASLELVKIALQAYGSGDSEIALALAAPLIRWDERASRPDSDLVWGHDKVQRAMRRYLDSWDEYRFDLEDVAEVGPGKVVGICRERGKPKDGPAVDRRFGGLWIVEEGKITAWATYLTPREAVRAAKELHSGRVELEQSKPLTAPAEAKPPMPVAAPLRPALEPVEPTPVPAQPAPEPVEAAVPEREDPQVAQRPRKRALTKSEEQKRAARARAKLRKRSSRQTA
jgi:ketosteroid isomerase-like protein